MPNDIEIADSSPERDQQLFVVGLGASAGGIRPLTEFFSRMAPDANIAYVVILHLSPEYESNLSALLQNRTTMAVTQVTSTVAVEPNHIYVIPPSKNLVMEDGVIMPTVPEPPRGAHTIDLCFRSLAEAYGKNAIAILLSGTGADGTLGSGRVKEEGGYVIAQDPKEAEYGDIPRNAISAGVVDMVLPVAEMAAKVLALRSTAERLQIAPEAEADEIQPPTDEVALREVLTILRLRTGNDFTQYKRPTLLRRFARRMQVNELPDLNAYVEYIHGHPEEVAHLLRDLLITVTNFFRDADTFETLEKEVIPELFVGKGPNDQVRVWSAGCATGEEAYSLAMLLTEYADRLVEPPRIQVFATDIDERAILEARECKYPETIGIDVSPERLRRFFSRFGDHYQIKKELRETVLFAVHNAVRDPPFSRLDLISCRNLLIYLNRNMQERVLEIFHFALRPHGFLFLGASESAEMTPAEFSQVDKKRRIYKRRETAARLPAAPALLSGKWPIRLPEPRGDSDGATSGGQLHQRVVEQLAPPSALVDDNYDVLHLSTHAARYMKISAGEPTHNILKLVHPDLRLDLRSGLLEAKNREAPDGTRSRQIGIEIEGKARRITLGVRAVTPNIDDGRGFFLVTFDETSDSSPSVVSSGPDSQSGLEAARKLEDELQRTREQLRVTIEQYETSTEELRASNEELQAINEELRSATEELETSKEELQSINEELSTVNQEYKEKIEEVGRVNSDLQNLMAAIEIGTIFLDRALQIKRYTPRVQQLFNITPGDVGRPLRHFTHQLDYPGLTDDAAEVLRTLQTLEREVHSADDRWYLARLLPYRTIEDKIDGVVLTFVDITNRRREEEQLRRNTAELQARAEILNMAPAFILDSERRILMWNSKSESIYGFSAEEVVGKNAHQLLRTEFPQPRSEIDGQLQRTGQWEGELVHTTKAGQRMVVASHWILHRSGPNRSPVILEMNIDVSERRSAEEALRVAHLNTDRFLATLSHELRNPLGAIRNGLALVRRGERDSAAANRAYEIVERQLGHLSRLVEDLVDVERMRHGRIRLQKSRLELRSVIDSATEMSQARIDDRGHQLKVTVPRQSIRLDGDLTRLAQVVSNLLDNAAKYTPRGGKVELIADCVGSEVVIKLRDSGMGISAEMLPKLFELYAQGPALPGNPLQGFGIGLALVRQIVELHGGNVSVSSDGPGKGSEFIVRLPISAPAGK